MTWVVWFGGVALVMVVTVVCSALIEVFRQLEQIRRRLSLEDSPTPIALDNARTAPDIGLPPELAAAPEALIVFLSSTCGTCLAIADAFRGGAPASVWFVLSAPPRPERLIDTLGSSSDRLVIDANDEIAAALNLKLTPSALVLSFGSIAAAYTVSTPRQVMSLIPTPLRADGGEMPAPSRESVMNAAEA